MTTYDNLPVYKESYAFFVELFRVTKEFEREYKYTIGESIKKETIELMTNIFKANSSFEERAMRIKSARAEIETIRLYLRLLKDLRQINIEKFASLNFKAESVSKQLTAWQKSCR